MADYGRRTVTKIRTEYVLESPASAVEFVKALTAARDEMPAKMRQYDDVLFVEASDDEVVIWWELED